MKVWRRHWMRHPLTAVSSVLWLTMCQRTPHVANWRVKRWRLISCDVQRTTATLQESWCLLHHGLSAHVRVSILWYLPTYSLIQIAMNTVTAPTSEKKSKYYIPRYRSILYRMSNIRVFLLNHWIYSGVGRGRSHSPHEPGWRGAKLKLLV